MIYKIELKDDTLLCDAMDILSKIGSFVFADMVLYVFSNKNLLKNKKINSISNDIRLLSYEDCKKINNSMVRQFCLDKIYEDSIKKIEKSQDGQQKIIEALNFINKMEELKEKGAIVVAKEEANKGSANEVVCESDN